MIRKPGLNGFETSVLRMRLGVTGRERSLFGMHQTSKAKTMETLYPHCLKSPATIMSLMLTPDTSLLILSTNLLVNTLVYTPGATIPELGCIVAGSRLSKVMTCHAKNLVGTGRIVGKSQAMLVPGHPPFIVCLILQRRLER